MIQIEGTVTRTDLCLSQPLAPLTSGCKNSAFLRLRFSRLWQEYTKRYVEFRVRGGALFCAAVSDAGICVIPEEALYQSGVIYLSVVGERPKKGGEADARVVTELAPLLVTSGGYHRDREAV